MSEHAAAPEVGAHTDASHTDGHSADDIKKHVKVYMNVFIALAVLTVVTVAASYLHLATAAAIGLALVIATVKGTLVAAFFMHMIGERKIVFYVLILTFFFFFVLLFVPAYTTHGSGF